MASGQSAETLALLTLAGAGDHIVSSASLYGGTYNLFHYTLPKVGIEVTFVDDPADIDAWKAAVRPNTKAFFGETLPNPKNDVFDIEPIAGVAHAEGLPLVVDNTVPTPYLIRPIEWGADIVVHSLTKFLGGHGTSIGGAIVDGGQFDFGVSGRFPGFTEPDPSYHGLAYWPALGPGSFVLKARVQRCATSAPLSPFNVFLILQGIETLSLRMERHFANAQKVAEYLDARDDVLSVAYAGLPEQPVPRAGAEVRRRHAVSARCSPSRSRAASRPASVSSRLSRCTVTWPTSATCAACVIHPASTTHSQLTPEEQAAVGRHTGTGAPERRPGVDRGHHRRPREGLRRRGRVVPPAAAGARRHGRASGSRRPRHRGKDRSPWSHRSVAPASFACSAVVVGLVSLLASSASRSAGRSSSRCRSRASRHCVFLPVYVVVGLAGVSPPLGTRGGGGAPRGRRCAAGPSAVRPCCLVQARSPRAG